MSLTASKTTLRHQLARPLCVKRDMATVGTVGAAKAVAKLVDGYEDLGMPIPETAALQFYLLQHAMSDIRQRFGSDEPMGAVIKIVEMYHELGVELGQRMFSYLLLICTREARHAGILHGHDLKMDKRFGLEFRTFIKEIEGMHSDAAVKAFCNNPPKMALGKYCEGLAWVFYNGKFSGGYGGELWGKVADVLAWFVKGEISAEMMLDTAFTLAHNGGPIFNKGLAFHGYDETKLLLVLNVQATGQIPQLISSLDKYPELNTYVTTATVQMYNTCRELLGEQFGGPIDWFKVDEQEQATGHVYEMLKQKQVAVFGVPGWVDASEIAKLEEAKVEKVASIDAMAEKLKKIAEEKAIYAGAHFTVGIGAPLTKSKRIHVKKKI